MASAAAPLRGLPLPANPAPHSRGRDIVSTILANYGGDPGIEFTPVEEEMPDKPAELRPPPRQFDRGALYSPRSGSEFGFGSGDDAMDDEYDPPRPASPRGSRKEKTAEKWQTKMAQQQKEVDLLREAQEKMMGGGKALPAIPPRIDSKFEKDLPLRPSSPLSSRTHASSPAPSEGPASNLKRSLSRSSKPASLKLHKSNGSTAASIRSTGSSTTPPPPPPKLQPTKTPTNPTAEQAPPPPPPKHPLHTRSNSVKSTYSVKRKPIQRGNDASESLSKAPSPTKSISTGHKGLPARPIEIDDFTVVDLAVKHPAVTQEQSLRATNLRQKPQLTASQRIDQLLDQTSQQGDQRVLGSNRPPQPSTLPTSQSNSSSESEDMKKVFQKVQSRLGRWDDNKVTDPAIQPGLGAEGSVDRSFRIKRDGLPTLPDEEERKQVTAGRSEGSLSSGYLRNERSSDMHKDRIDSGFRSGSNSASMMMGDNGSSEGRSTLDRTLSSSTHATITQPSYDRRERERLAPINTDTDMTLPAFDPIKFDNALGYNEPSGPNPVFEAGSSLGIGDAGSSEARPPTPTSATAADKFASAVEALKLHQAKLNAPQNVGRKPVFGPVRPPHGPIAHLVANRTSNQNQVKLNQLECKNDHQRWFGPRPNDAHCVPCQLCLVADRTLFQCRDCAMVTCAGCRGKVEDVMARKRAVGVGRN